MKNIQLSKRFSVLALIIVAAVFLLPNIISIVNFFLHERDYGKQYADYQADVAAQAAQTVQTRQPGPADEKLRLSFIEPLESDKPLSYPESRFSVPRPVVILDPLIVDVPGDHSDKTIFRRTGPFSVQARLSGTVYDLLADSVADDKADIRSVKIQEISYVAPFNVPVRKLQRTQFYSIPPNPWADELAQGPPRVVEALRPFAFVGRFETPLMDVELNGGSDLRFMVEAVNADGESGYANLEVGVHGLDHKPQI